LQGHAVRVDERSAILERRMLDRIRAPIKEADPDMRSTIARWRSFARPWR
jgi:hypothetical protein